MKFGVGKKSNIVGYLAVVFVVFSLFSVYPLVSADSWPMLLHDPQHTGNSTSIGPDTNFTLWFTPSIGGNGWSSPAVANGMVFISRGGNGVLYALYETNGTEIWNTAIGVAGQACSTPAVSDGKVYIVGNRLYCFYESNGTEVWNKLVSGSGTGTSSPTVADGKVFLNTQTLYCFYADNGTDIWNVSLGGNGESTPAVADGKVYTRGWMSGMGERLICIYANNGTELWNISGGGSNSPTVANGRVFFNPSQIKCFYASNGTEIWSQSNGGDGYSSPAVAYGKIFLNNGGDIYCLYENNGTEIWQITIDGSGCSTPAVDAVGKVFINGGTFSYCLNGGSGAEIWKISTGGDGWSSPAIANGRVFVNQGTVYCFGAPPETIDYIIIRDEPAGTGNEIQDQNVGVGTTITGYAAAYNYTVGYVYDIPVNWWVVNGSGANASTTPTNYVAISDFYSGYNEGSATLTADDGNGHTDTVFFTIDPPEVDYIRIVDTENTGTVEIPAQPVDVGYSMLGHAASYNRSIGYLGDITVTWSVINSSGAEGLTSPLSGTNSTVNAGPADGIVEWMADDGSGHTDSVIFTVNPPTVDYIIIMSGPNGSGSWVGDSTYIFGDSDTFYAAGFNYTSGWAEDVYATWGSDDPFVGNVTFGPWNSTTFDALNNGTCNITAIYNPLTNTTGVISIISYNVDRIIIRDTPGNGGSRVGDRTYPVGEIRNFYVAAYNNSAPDDGYIGDVGVDWESSDVSIGTVTTPGVFTQFNAQSIEGECNVTARYNDVVSNTTGTLTVLAPTVDYVLIRDTPGGGGDEVTSRTYNIGDTDTFYAAGYNDTAGYLYDVAVTWSSTNPENGDVDEGPGISTSFYASSNQGGTTIVTAASSDPSIQSDTTGTLRVTDPTIDFIIIRDAVNGGGNIVHNRQYHVGEEEVFYAAAYNTTAGYLNEMNVLWFVDSSEAGSISPQNSQFTTFRASMIGGTCNVTARYSLQISNITGILTVMAPTVDYIQIQDGSDNVLVALTLDFGEWMFCYALGYNMTAGSLGNVEVNWSMEDAVASTSPGLNYYTNVSAVIEGSTTLTAVYNAVIQNTTQVTIRARISAPAGVTVVGLPQGGVLNISWNENLEENLAGYDIYISLSSTGPFTKINSALLTTTIFVDDGLTNGIRYYYYIVAVDTDGESSVPSDIASGIPDRDTDGDGIFDFIDEDDDNDGLPDTSEAMVNTNPLIADSDGDGVIDGDDYFPTDPAKWDKPDEEGEDISLMWILIPVIVLIVLLLLFFLLARRRKPEDPAPPSESLEELPPPPGALAAEDAMPPPPEDRESPPPDDEWLPPPPPDY